MARPKKSIVLTESSVGEARLYVVKRLTNSIQYQIGSTLTPKDVKALLALSSGNAWTVKIEASGN